MLIEKIPDRSFFFWQMEDAPVIMGGAILEVEGQEERIIHFSTGTEFIRRAVKFTPPRGQFLEVLLLLKNTSEGDFKDEFSSEGSFHSNISLLLPNQEEILPVDFLLPGLSNSSLSHLQELQEKGLTVISDFTGVLQASLEPGGETWILLLFDVPSDSQSAQLRLKDADPITIQW